MSLKINKFVGFRYRRYGAGLLIAAAAWLPYAVSTFFIFPSWEAFAAALLLTAGGCIPLLMLARHCFAVAEDYLAEERAQHARTSIRLANR